jgi:hypothetical protein
MTGSCIKLRESAKPCRFFHTAVYLAISLGLALPKAAAQTFSFIPGIDQFITEHIQEQ